MPTCTKCKEEFAKIYCKGKCKRCYTKDYREKNHAKIKAYSEKWHAENPGKAYDYIEKWRKSDNGKEYLKILRQSDSYKEYRGQWLSDNPEKTYEYHCCLIVKSITKVGAKQSFPSCLAA